MKARYDRLYDPNAVRALFDEMSKTYGIVNLFASFGFTVIWRRMCLAKFQAKKNVHCLVDLMTGMGELLAGARKFIEPTGNIRAVDFSPRMCERAREAARGLGINTEIIEADIFDGRLPAGCADRIVCSFGLKTFSIAQQQDLARLVARLLKPGGDFSFIEISIPESAALAFFYSFYLKWVIPLIGRIFLGNPDNYRFLGIYAWNFQNSRGFHRFLLEEKLETEYFEHFFGCATGVHGRKPGVSQ